MRSLPLAFLLMASCRGTEGEKEAGTVDSVPDTAVDTQVEPVDVDGDGFFAEEDCDDADGSVHPGAEETCDGIDNDCDGLVDDADDSVEGQGTWFADLDQDGFGNPASSELACEAPEGSVADDTDCDDLNPAFFPGADESDCTDPADYNCDGSVGFSDADGDGFAACEDCDDGSPTVSPLGTEVCDGVDNDCDGTVDEDDAVDAVTWFADSDVDGTGDDAVSVEACEAPSGYVSDDSDCDDTDGSVHPGALETCDGLDNDCDALVDDADPSLSGGTVFYGDSDGDGYGGQQYQQVACSAPAGFVTNADDCDDLDASSHPGGSEVCDGVDNDCDTQVDEGVQATWYQDSDGDGYGNGSVSQESCDMPTGYVENASDCDDFDAATHPGSYEICDAVDNDCDGAVDEDAINGGIFYLDSDGDGYGSLAGWVSACSVPSGYAANASDCDDGDATVSPGGAEACNGVDSDCNGLVDDGVGSTFYLDSDGDGHGDPNATTTSCNQPGGYVAGADDCDDSDGAVNPSATELCDGLDNDCDGTVDGVGSLGSGAVCAGESCQAILTALPGSGDGTYWLDPDQDGSGAFETYCDMTSDGGGWTLVGLVHRANQASVHEPDDWFTNGYDATALTTNTSTDNASPSAFGVAAFSGYIASQGGVQSRFSLHAQADATVEQTWFKTVDATSFALWFSSDGSQASTQVCADEAMTQSCSNGRIINVGSTTNLEGMTTGGGCSWHMRTNGNSSPAYTGICTCDGGSVMVTGYAGHWGHPMRIWIR